MKDALRPASLGAAPPPRWPRSRLATGSFYREARTAFVLGLPQDLQLYCKYFQFSCTKKTRGMRRERFAGGAHSRASVASLMLGDIFT